MAEGWRQRETLSLMSGSDVRYCWGTSTCGLSVWALHGPVWTSPRRGRCIPGLSVPHEQGRAARHFYSPAQGLTVRRVWGRRFLQAPLESAACHRGRYDFQK